MIDLSAPGYSFGLVVGGEFVSLIETHWDIFHGVFPSICMAAGPGHLPDLTLLATFAAGSFVMRGAGCTINDMWDRNIDNKVERTRDRPITSGQVSMFDALVFLGGQLGIGLLILLQLNW